MFDVHILLKNNKIEDVNLAKAIAATFKERNVVFEENPALFTESYYKDEKRIIMWKAFLRKIKITGDWDFPLILKTILERLQPIYNELSNEQ